MAEDLRAFVDGDGDGLPHQLDLDDDAAARAGGPER
jgi:hypothetical protein